MPFARDLPDFAKGPSAARRMGYGNRLYAIQDEVTHALKVGRSYDPERRLATLQTGTAHKLALRGSFYAGLDKEAVLHRRLASLRIAGEWFDWGKPCLSEDVVELQEAIRAHDHWINDFVAFEIDGLPVRKRIVRLDQKELVEVIRQRKEAADKYGRLTANLQCVVHSYPEWEDRPNDTMADILELREP